MTRAVVGPKVRFFNPECLLSNYRNVSAGSTPAGQGSVAGQSRTSGRCRAGPLSCAFVRKSPRSVIRLAIGMAYRGGGDGFSARLTADPREGGAAAQRGG